MVMDLIINLKTRIVIKPMNLLPVVVKGFWELSRLGWSLVLLEFFTAFMEEDGVIFLFL